MAKDQSRQANVTVFLDAVLSGHSGWQLAVERSVQTRIDPATFALLAKAHGSRLGVIDASSDHATHQENGSAENRNGASMALSRMPGAVVVCTAESLSKPELLLPQLPPDAAVLILDDERQDPQLEKLLSSAGFVEVDAISVPYESTFWLRSRARSEFVPQSVASAFINCLHKKGGMNPGHYFRIVVEILRHAPCNLLIFGAGADTALYVEANAGGRTTVVEHHAEWRSQIAKLNCETVAVEYKSSVKEGLREDVELPQGLSPELLDVRWSIIVIDSPEGHEDDMPGRQQSILAAAKAAKSGTTVFLHDYNRTLEKQAAERYFGKPDETVGAKPCLGVFHSPRCARVERKTRSVDSSNLPAVNDSSQPIDALSVGEPREVSVIIPTYNEGAWLKRTVESVLAAKTAVDYEIIVVDDASNDGSVEEVRNLPRVRVASVGEKPVGCVVGRNLGAKVARGEYLCFLDSHVLVEDDWLERLRETAVQFGDRTLVSGNILNVDHKGMPDVEKQQYAYTLKAWSVESAWHFHGHAKKTEPYRAPLCPAGLMFVKRSYFLDIGGFGERIKKWGGTDVEISLKNYMYGGENIVDPRVFIYHYYKNTKDRKPTFSISYKQTFFNRLFIAKAFGSDAVYKNAQAVLAKKSKIADFVSEVESEENQRFIQNLQKRFVRSWDDFARDFPSELKHCFTPVEKS